MAKKKRQNHTNQTTEPNLDWESKKILFEASFKETHALASNIITLSTAFLGTTLVFFEKLQRGTPIHFWQLQSGSLLLVLSIVLIIIIRLLKLESIKCASRDDWDRCGQIATPSEWLTYLSALIFAIGISFITFFLLANLTLKEVPVMSKEPRRPSPPPTTPAKPPVPKPEASPGRRTNDNNPSYNPSTIRPPKPTNPGKP